MPVGVFVSKIGRFCYKSNSLNAIQNIAYSQWFCKYIKLSIEKQKESYPRYAKRFHKVKEGQSEILLFVAIKQAPDCECH